MTTHEDYVTLATAKKLKAMGFDWPTTHYYATDYTEDDADLVSAASSPHDWNTREKRDAPFLRVVASAPTLYQVQKWIREKGTDIDVLAVLSSAKKKDYEVILGYWIGNMPDYIVVARRIRTYKAALSAGIEKALELIEEKK